MPFLGDVIYPCEVEIFHVQHYCTGIICPLVLLISQRYSEKPYFHLILIYFVFNIQGFQHFVLYQRLFLSVISYFTWANLNFCLCGASSKLYLDDSFYQLLGNYYYIFAEFYAFLPCLVYTSCLLMVSNLAVLLKNKI